MKNKFFIFFILIFGILNAQLAIVGNDKKFGFMDKSGKIVIPIQFKEAGCFCDGRAAVEVKGKWGFIDTSGKLVGQWFDFAEIFTE
jgi:hypothetical protein